MTREVEHYTLIDDQSLSGYTAHSQGVMCAKGNPASPSADSFKSGVIFPLLRSIPSVLRFSDVFRHSPVSFRTKTIHDEPYKWRSMLWSKLMILLDLYDT
nr:hypothetical protein CFP56_30750 [Quercus suber]